LEGLLAQKVERGSNPRRPSGLRGRSDAVRLSKGAVVIADVPTFDYWCVLRKCAPRPGAELNFASNGHTQLSFSGTGANTMENPVDSDHYSAVMPIRIPL
jgi:hypothetical protein